MLGPRRWARRLGRDTGWQEGREQEGRGRWGPEPSPRRLALVGNPNVGKSTLFNRLTGGRAATANYPGTTVRVEVGRAWLGGPVEVLDLPGSYSVQATDGTEAEEEVASALASSPPDAILAVIDATNLARNLVLVLELMELGIPMAVALNLVDEAEREGSAPDSEALSRPLGIPVVPTVATRGAGALRAALAALEARPPPRPPYRPEVAALLEGVGGRGSRAEPPPGFILLAAERHRLARELATLAGAPTGGRSGLRRRAEEVLLSPVSGPISLVLLLVATLFLLFVVGDALSRALDALWSAGASPLIRRLIHALAGEGVWGRVLTWAFDSGIEAVLSVGIPYVAVFYLFLAVLEDSGVLSAASFVADRAMRRLGLSGRALIPLVAGSGCNVPAIMGTRVLPSRKERTIASALIVMVPCSARIAVISGAVSRFVGKGPALAIFALDALIVAAAGAFLKRTLPGKSSGLLMEIFPLRKPSLGAVARKAWYRAEAFVFKAVPVVTVGSLALGTLYETGWIWKAEQPLRPLFAHFLRIPTVAGIALIFAILRKELALQLLVALAAVKYGPGAENLLKFMTPQQIWIYALVNTVQVPCVATLAALSGELGPARAAAIAASTVVTALGVGGLAAFLLRLPIPG